MCPITLRDERTKLIKGHILNDALKLAAGWRVPQRADVDHHFGETIEPDFIKWLNADSLTLPEAVEKGRRFSVELPGGEICRALPSNTKGVSDRLPKLPICDEDGRPIAEVYIKTKPENVVGLKGLTVSLRLSVNDSAVVGSWIKAAYLALFRRCGYRYVYTKAGEYVRSALSDFVTSDSDETDAHYFFDRFKGCVHFLAGEQVPHFQNTIEDGVALVHKADDIMFALSCLFRVNKVLHMVTLPLQAGDERWFSVICRYDRFLRNPTMQQEIIPAIVEPDQVRIGDQQLKLEFEGDVDQVRGMLADQVRA
jgi:hypothetical protein